MRSPSLRAAIGADLVQPNSAGAARRREFDRPIVARPALLRRHLVGGGQGRAPLPSDFALAARAGRARALRAADAVVAPSGAFAAATARAYGPATRRSSSAQRPDAPAIAPSDCAAGDFVSHRRPAVGRRQERRDARRGRRAARRSASGGRAAGRAERREHRARPCTRSSGSSRRHGSPACWRRGRSSPRRRSTSRSGLRCSKRRRPAARWCSPTSRRFRELWDGAALFVPPRRSGALRARRSTTCSRDRRRRGARSAQRARGRARSATRPSAMARGMLDALRAAPRRRRPAANGGRRHEDRLFHPLAALLLEPRQRAFPARRPERAGRARARRSRLRTGGRVEPRQSA